MYENNNINNRFRRDFELVVPPAAARLAIAYRVVGKHLVFRSVKGQNPFIHRRCNRVLVVCSTEGYLVNHTEDLQQDIDEFYPF